MGRKRDLEAFAEGDLAVVVRVGAGNDSHQSPKT
jgi:hypothetical protein